LVIEWTATLWCQLGAAPDRLARAPVTASQPGCATATAGPGAARSVKPAWVPGRAGTDPARLPTNRPPATRPSARTAYGRQCPFDGVPIYGANGGHRHCWLRARSA